MSAPAVTTMPTGERIDWPDQLVEAVAIAMTQAARVDDDLDVAKIFADAFMAALFQRGLILVARGRSNSKETVLADTYALALDGKHAAERTIESIAKLVLGSDGMPSPLLDDFSDGILATVGRLPPDDRPKLFDAMLRLRGIAGILNGAADLGVLPPLPDPLVQFFNGELPGAPAAPSPPIPSPPEAA